MRRLIALFFSIIHPRSEPMAQQMSDHQVVQICERSTRELANRKSK